MTAAAARAEPDEIWAGKPAPGRGKKGTEEQSRFNLVLRDGGEILFSSRRRGLRPLLECAGRWPGPAERRTLIDRVIGIAAARVIAAARPAGRVKAGVISEEAIRYLEVQSLAVDWEETTAHIHRKDGSGICPLEELSRRHESDREFLTEIYRHFSLRLPEFVSRMARE